jgi:hypothetical protein
MSETCKEVVEETATRLETGPVYQAAKDLIDRYFKNTDKCLASIPARPDVDADLVLMTGLERAAALIRALEARAEASEARNKALEEALAWYADPERYKPHPHGIAFNRRDISYTARAALEPKP